MTKDAATARPALPSRASPAGNVIPSAAIPRSGRWRWLTAGAAMAAVLALGPLPGNASTSSPSPRTIHLVAHEQQHKFLNQGGLGDEEIFRGILDNAAGKTRVGIFAGTLTSVSANDSLNLATVDLQLPGSQITVQGFFFRTQSRIVHAIIGGTGSYTGAEGEFPFTSPSPGVLDMTLTLLP